MDVAELWARWRPKIASATGDHQTIESIEALLASGAYHLWATERCCFVLEFVDYPGGAKAAQLLWAAGSIEALLDELPRLEDFMRKAGRTEILIEGPAGWARVLRNAGYNPWSVTTRKEL